MAGTTTRPDAQAEELARLRQELAEREAQLAERHQQVIEREAHLAERDRQLAEAREREQATADVLRILSETPHDLQMVLHAVAQRAAQLCACYDVTILGAQGDSLIRLAYVGDVPATGEQPVSIGRDWPSGRAAADGVLIHVPDLAAVEEAEFPRFAALNRNHPLGKRPRTLLSTPLKRNGRVLGVFSARRTVVQPFTEQEIRLLATFADQAVIAIENARLFSELQESNLALTQQKQQLQEALEQQTATADILRVIASSPAELQRVLETVAEAAARLCEADSVTMYRREEDLLRAACRFSVIPDDAMTPVGHTVPVHPDHVVGRAVLGGQTVHVPDLAAVPAHELPAPNARQSGIRTGLAVPLLRQGEAIGVIAAHRRREVRPFTDEQIALLETFADQAVIAIENTRLFTELQEQLERQTATAEILRVIAGSPTDLHVVFGAIVENAARLCDATAANLHRLDGGNLMFEASHRPRADGRTTTRFPHGSNPIRGAAAQVFATRQTIHLPDLDALTPAEGYGRDWLDMMAGLHIRTWLGAPLLSKGEPIGVLVVQRLEEARPFNAQQITLLETFADQAVIAIENARLFGELQERTRELARSVEELTALSEVTHAVTSTLDLEEVLARIAAHAQRLAGADGAAIFEFDEASQGFHARATHDLEAVHITALQASPVRLGSTGLIARAAAARRPLQAPEVLDEAQYTGPLREVLTRTGVRALLSVPLLREDRLLGGLTLYRRTPGEFPPAIVDLMQTFASQSALAIQNARLFREIEEKGRQLEEASRHKSQFLANMSHELRTPLNAILGYTELIVDGIYGEVPQKLLEVLERVQQSGQHLLGLINAVLDLSKIEAGQLVLSLQDYSLKEVVHTVLTATESLAAEKGLALVAEVAPELPMGYGDERRLTQVLLNLVGNALKFTDAGSVTIRADVEGERFQVAVTDTGPGIAPEEQAKIFEEFQQVGTVTRQQGGTGLGLAIAQRIVELHGGHIWVDSQLGQGATFTFTVPVRVAAAIAT